MEDRVFTPKFIPIYTDIRDKYDLKPRDAQTFGFIKFYVTSTGNQFYFGDEAMMRILNYKKGTLYDSLEVLENKGLIKIYNPYINGFKKRVIQLQDLKKDNTLVSKTTLSQYRKRHHNNNTENKIINKENNKNSYLDKYIDNPDNIFKTDTGSIPDLPF
jgi:DNA-binding PadR family transcriptional regulator